MPDQRTKYMKAWVLHAPGDLRFEEVTLPQPAPDEVLIPWIPDKL